MSNVMSIQQVISKSQPRSTIENKNEKEQEVQLPKIHDLPGTVKHNDQAKCSICGGLKVIRQEWPLGNPRFGSLDPCPCQSTSIKNQVQVNSNMTSFERAKILEEIVIEGRPGTKMMVDACQSFVLDPIGIMTIYGTCGNAKTDALQAIVNELTNMSINALYVTAFDLVGDIRAAIQEGGNIRERLRNYENIRVLVIDEFDKVKNTEWVDEQFTELIDARYRKGLAGESGTVIAMNKDPRELSEWISSRLSDGRNRMIENCDPDMRSLLK
jgi:DNA replication protein DnaC